MSNDFLLTLIALGIALCALIANIFLILRIQKLTRGKNGSSLEDVICTLQSQTKTLEKNQQTTDAILKDMYAKIGTTIRATGMVKFNALPDLGGNQSVALALLTEQKKGYLFTILTVRERIQLFIKKVENGACDQELVPEEKESLRIALSSLKQ